MFKFSPDPVRAEEARTRIDQVTESPTRRLEAYTQVAINGVILGFGFIFFNVMIKAIIRGIPII